MILEILLPILQSIKHKCKKCIKVNIMWFIKHQFNIKTDVLFYLFFKLQI